MTDLAAHPTGTDVPRRLVVGLIGFLTLVDLFAAQALLPAIAAAYGVSPGAAGLAVNAGTLGMAVSGLAVSVFAERVDRRRGAAAALALLAVPTFALGFAPDLPTFAALRIAQGAFMAAAFALTMAYLAERAGPREVSAALAAYVTGVVASNLVGRLLATSVAASSGLPDSFAVLAGLNLAGAALVSLTLRPSLCMPQVAGPAPSRAAALADHLASAALLPAFGIGFLILFLFIGVFTYVNFVLAAEPFALGTAQLGLVYLVFAPALLTTPLAGRAAGRFGARATVAAAFGLCLAALPLLVVPSLPALLLGLALVAAGTFFAQAATTGYVGRTATHDRAAASGLYLTSYYLGGLAGAAAFGAAFEAGGWVACVIGFGVTGLVAATLALALRR